MLICTYCVTALLLVLPLVIDSSRVRAVYYYVVIAIGVVSVKCAKRGWLVFIHSLNNSHLSPTAHILQFLPTSRGAFLFVFIVGPTICIFSPAQAPVRCEHRLPGRLRRMHQMLLNHFEIVSWVNLRLLSDKVCNQVLTISTLILLCSDTVPPLLIHITRCTPSHINHI